MEAQVESAIEIASSPTSAQALRGEAIAYLNQLRTDGSAWQACLNLFTRDPRPQEIVRHTSLDLLNNAVQEHRLDEQSLAYIKDNLMAYVRQTYSQGRGATDTSYIQNKLMQTMTYLFTTLYPSTWQTFFDDFRELAGDKSVIGTVNVSGTILYLRMLGQIHDEIADVLLSRSKDEQNRNTDLKDLIRARDVQKIAVSWQEILAKWRETDLNIIEMCLRTVSKWVSWIDISLVVNEAMITHFLEMAGQQGVSSADSAEGRVRDAAIDAFSDIVGKKMKPSDKMELIVILDLVSVVGKLIGSPALSDLRNTPDYDNDLAETVAKLVNNIVSDIVRVLDTNDVDGQTRQRAEELVQVFAPHLLRFFSDQYDEVCMTVIPSLTDLLTLFRKIKKDKGTLPAQYAAMLPPILDAIVGKMEYDETASWGDEDGEADDVEFQDLRKRLHVLQQSVALADESLYLDTMSRVVGNVFSRMSSNDPTLTWRDLDLALHEMFLFGDLAAKNQGLYQKREPSSVAAQRLVEMMSSMVDSDIANYPHPAIQLQYMDNCVRYVQFFEQNSGLIPKTLENFVRLTHHNHIKVRAKSWYLLHRFVRPLRAQIGNVSQEIIQAIGDLLTIKAELPNDSGEDDMSSDEDDKSADALFNSQLYLFETVGCIASSATVSAENKKLYAQTIMNPLFADLEQTLAQASNGDERAVLQIHHIIMAIGTLAKGFSDWIPNGPLPPPSEVSEEFSNASNAILIALRSLNASMQIRSAARFAFSRMIAILGGHLLQQLPEWIEGLLSQSSTMDEMATFLKVLDQIIFTFKADIAGIFDNLLTPLLQTVFRAFDIPVTGTDDQIQLAELRREYLNFINALLIHDLGSVLVSPANQSTFELIIKSIETFARDTTDYPTARLGITVLIRMTSVWGGPDKLGAGANNSVPTSPINTQSSLPGFDEFAVTRFSPLSWTIPTTPGFNPKDAQARQVLQEVAGLQVEILKKVGTPYGDRLSEELRGMGISDQGIIDEYLRFLVGALEGQKKDKEWRQFFVKFIERAIERAN